MKILNGVRMVGIGAIAVALAAGCAASTAKTSTAPTSGGTVNATLTDMKVSVDHSTMQAGPVTFVVKNTGAVAHELVLLQTDVAQDKIAANPAEAGKVIETGNLGETGDMAVGETKSFTATLAAGHYVLVCNEIGHYDAGMHMTFTVQ